MQVINNLICIFIIFIIFYAYSPFLFSAISILLIFLL
jgi:hypothetical protein